MVGNITLGGTGKTPMVIWLVEHLRNRGLRVGVVSRGYGARPPTWPWLVQPTQDSAEQVGDEPLLIASRCQVPLVIDPDRPRAARHLLEQAPVDVIVSDDGLQHYRLGRTLELVMIDHGRGLGNGRCLPEGRCASRRAGCGKWTWLYVPVQPMTAPMVTPWDCNPANWSI